jgi:oligopeptide/dipeptide ABC transporter ATP-binding protein
MILKLLDPDAGHIYFKGQEITALSDKQMRPLRKQIQIIFQDPYGSLNPRMTVAQAISEGLKLSGAGDAQQQRDRMKKLVETVGLSPRVLDRYPHEFSGGQRQRIGIARALSVKPSLVICDEPISALDVSIQAQIINLLEDLQNQLNLSYLFISHDLNVVGYLSDYVAVMYKGQVVEYGPSESIFTAHRHPYTRILLSAVPDPEADRKTSVLAPETRHLEIEPPPEGCRLFGKCPIQDPQCKQDSQDIVQIGEKHYVRCWKAESQNRPDALEEFA